MIEDKLTAAQRIRLEATAQSNIVIASVAIRAGAKDAATATTSLTKEGPDGV